MPNTFEEAERLMTEDRFAEAADRFTAALRERPKDAEILRRRALAFLYDAEYEKARADIDRAVTLAPGEPGNYLRRVFIRGMVDEAAEVDDDLETVRRLDPENPEFYVTLAGYRFTRSDLPGATEAADHAVRLDPESYAALYFQNVCHVWNDRNDEAERGFEKVRKAIERLPSPLEFQQLVCYGSTLLFLGETKTASAIFDEGIRRFPKLPMFLLYRTVLYEGKGRWDELRADLDRAEKMAERDSLWESSLLFGRATLFDVEEQYALAEEQLDLVLARLPNHLEAMERKISMAQNRFAAGELQSEELAPYLDIADRLCSLRPRHYRYYLQRHWLHHRLGHEAEAETDRNVTISLVPDRAQELHHVAVWLIDTDCNDEAGDLLDRVLTLKPNHVEALRARGSARLWAGKADLAFEDLDRAVRLREPDVDADLLEGRAAALTELGEYEFFDISYGKALNDLDRAIGLQPENPVLWWRRGLVRYRLALKSFWNRRGHGRRSLDDYTEAIRLAPEDASSWYCRALTHQLLKNFDAALADCDEALRLNPEFAEARQFRDDCRADD